MRNLFTTAIFLFASIICHSQDPITRIYTWEKDLANCFEMIAFKSPIGQLKVTEREIFVTDRFGQIQFSEIDKSGLMMLIIKDVQKEATENLQKQINELREKVYFYEEHFGTLKGDGDCKTFTPSNKPFKHCDKS